MGQPQVARWRKHGKDRLYVNQPDGRRLGWHDLLDGTDHADSPDHLAAVQAAAARWRAERVPTPPRGDQDDPHSAVAPDWYDLAGRAPGQMALAQADAMRAAAPKQGFWARLFGPPPADRSWRVGARGEQLVGQELARLIAKEPRWTCLHAVPVGVDGSDIDHVVIGPAGVFTLNTKHHPAGRIWVGARTVLVNGTRVPYLRNARHEAERASRLLTAAAGFPVRVQGVVVVIASSLTVKEHPFDVAVIGRRQLRLWFGYQPECLTPETAAAVYDVARRSTTWSSTRGGG
ncbi:nuclease-related domain-containing protein [Cellulomonas xiejunii]|uniref:NERD domain-containing protein n=1 Tax=Cellulomonas xiejunii TaxID=2968083 RepID=A0ABY5KNV6_9CELL|nr:nuclease-related domain-containing protein [Cellulomonas xiejunii]MCC2321354.1 NERD domain-containing protein [Cellulomonas xiejunii]UUI71939.1 NERD domain-containing protein [Cellulomonas xiejunii]